MRQIYQKYRNDRLRLATILLNDVSNAEDIVHDVFQSFAQSAETLKLGGNLTGKMTVITPGGAYALSEALWEEWLQLEAGPGEDIGIYEETVEGRAISFRWQRYLLSDGTEVIWSVGTPKDDQ